MIGLPAANDSLKGASDTEKRAGAAGGPDARECGFSLVEALLVLGISALLLAVSAPAFAAFVSRFSVDADAVKIRSHLRMAQGLAIKDQVDRQVVFDVADSSYRLESATGTVASDALSDGVAIVPPPVTTFPLKDGKIAIAFHGSGWGSAGTLVIRSSGGKERRIVVRVGTGKVLIR